MGYLPCLAWMPQKGNLHTSPGSRYKLPSKTPTYEVGVDEVCVVRSPSGRIAR
jgi:hypothetical protein